MKLVKQHFYSGPNVWSSQSGLLLVVEYPGLGEPPLPWHPSDQELTHLLQFLQQVFPVASESEAIKSGEGIRNTHEPLMFLLLAVAEIVIRDFSILPRMGNVIDLDQGNFRIFLPCEDPEIGLAAWSLSMKVADMLAKKSWQTSKQAFEELGKHYWQFRQFAYNLGLNQSTVALARSALKQGIPHYRFSRPGQMLVLGQGRYRERIVETGTDKTSHLGAGLSRDKLATISLLSAHGLPTPYTHAISSEEDALKVARKLGFPIVVKPRGANKGKGVTTNITTEAGVVAAVKVAGAYQRGVLVERFILGEDHRLLVVGGHFVAAARRVPATVIGNGRHTVRQLIEILNRDPRRGMPFERLLEWVTLDDEAMELIASANMSLETIPKVGQQVPLRRVANLSRGGTSTDVTDLIHPDNKTMAERVARLVGLDVTGIDFQTPDIGRSWREVPCAILELNVTPGLRPHLAANPHRDVVKPIIEHLFPGNIDGRIPTVGITGSLGKTTTCQMVARIFSEAGKRVALSTTQGAWIGQDQIVSGDVAGGGSASKMLIDPGVEAGVFELARGGLVKKGMGLDAVDVGVVLNVHDNHVGLDGVNSREELARVKRLVVEHARKLAVLNADDPLCLAMRAHVRSPRLCLVSEKPDNPALQRHMHEGGLAAFLDSNDGAAELKLYEGERPIGKIAAVAIPAALEGRFRPAMMNALNAMAAAWGAGVDFPIIKSALCSFHSDHDTNPGRMNLIEGLPYKLLITWADGPQAMAELADYVKTLDVPGKKIIVFASTGNRPDSFISNSARAVAGTFSNYICIDQEDLRGRQSGETAGLLAHGLRESGINNKDITIAPGHENGLEMAYASASPGDLLVVVTYTGEKAWQKARLVRNKPAF